MNDIAEKFLSEKYFIARNSISRELTEVLAQYLFLKKNFGHLYKEKFVDADHLNREPILETVLDFLAERVSRYTGLSLIPTYAYSRIYHKGADLHRHIDKPACEVSCTIPLDFPNKQGWIFLASTSETDGETVEIDLAKGDMLVYRGEEVYHWRDKLQEDWQAQLFIHYVIKDGDNAAWQFDKRDRLSMDLQRLDLFNGTETETEKEQRLVYFIKQQLRLLKLIYTTRKLAPWLIAGAVIAVTYYFFG